MDVELGTASATQCRPSNLFMLPAHYRARSPCRPPHSTKSFGCSRTGSGGDCHCLHYKPHSGSAWPSAKGSIRAPSHVQPCATALQIGGSSLRARNANIQRSCVLRTDRKDRRVGPSRPRRACLRLCARPISADADTYVLVGMRETGPRSQRAHERRGTVGQARRPSLSPQPRPSVTTADICSAFSAPV